VNRTIPIVRGDIRAIKTTLVDKATALPIDISGWAVTFSLVGQDGAIAIEKVLDEDPESASGVALAVLDATDTASLTAGMTYTAHVIYDSPSGPITVPIALCPIQHPARTLPT